MRRKLKVPVIKIITLLLPAIRGAVASITAAREADSDEGKKISREEWEEIILEALLQLIPELAGEMEKANPQ